MTVPLSRPATSDGLFLWVMHRFAEVFEDHAIIKGGIQLRLLECPRSTTDIDYVFVPFRSKKEIVDRIRSVLTELEDAETSLSVHSKMLRATVRLDSVSIQIEASVSMECSAMSIATAGFATEQGQPSRIVRVMTLDHALAHKLAAWNERRLMRDLYDCYYLSVRLGGKPNLSILDARLERVESRIPSLKNRKSMTRAQLVIELRSAAESLDERALRDQLAPVLPAEELEGLAPRIRSAVIRIAERLEL